MRKQFTSRRYGIGFHGSATRIQEFVDSKVGLGGDPNSALGLFMSHVPMNALEYALNANEMGEGDEVNVYVIAYPTQGKSHDLSPDEYYGFDEDGNPGSREHFGSLRETLLASGYDQITCDTGEDSVTIALRPSACRVIAVLNEQQIYELGEHFGYMDPALVYEALTPLLKQAKPKPACDGIEP